MVLKFLSGVDSVPSGLLTHTGNSRAGAGFFRVAVAVSIFGASRWHSNNTVALVLGRPSFVFPRSLDPAVCKRLETLGVGVADAMRSG